MSYIEERAERKANAITEVKNWMATLAGKNQLITINVEYSGYGDSLDEFRSDEIEIPQNIMDHLYDLLPPGFENNEGGQGVIVLDPKTMSIKIEHKDFYTATEESSYEF